MQARPILIVSLVVNVLLIAGWLMFRAQDHTPAPGADAPGYALPAETTTNTYVRKEFFSWEELESEDYQTYIENLRNINCPEGTIREIIIADVDDLFLRRRAAEALPVAQQWWQREPDPEILGAALAQRRRLDQERNLLLTQLLGPDWASPIPPIPTVAIKVPLEGTALSSLTEETRLTVQQISGQAQKRFEQVVEAGGAYGPDPAALAGLETNLREQLTPLLTPPQLEDFLFRFAPTSHRLSAELASIPLFDATDLELRMLFRNVEGIDLELMSLAGDDAGVEARRRALLRSREIAFRNALGPARFREFEQLQDPAFQDAVAVAEAAGMSSSAGLFYAIDQAGREAEAEIRADPTLSPLQQEAAVLELQREQLEAAGVVLGEPASSEPPPPAPRTYSFQRGDSIADLSQRTGVPVALILRANPGLSPEGIPPGTEIVIPDSTTAPFPP